LNRSLWVEGGRVFALDQTLLPFERRVIELSDPVVVAEAISTMRVRGAPLIGIAAAFGLALSLRAPSGDAYALLRATRPTAVNLAWALDRVRRAAEGTAAGERFARAWAEASRILDEDIAMCSSIGDHGLALLRALPRRNVLTHCNAGWLATGAWGTALAPVYKAHEAGLDVHVWVDETRPRSQGASLTAWELGEAGVPHTLVTDTMAGHLMRTGRVDICLVGSDRTTARGDVCNKIGTYLVALAAHDNGVPFYACVPTSSIDFTLQDGAEVPIEERSPLEVTHVRGQRVAPEATKAANFAFDVTPARLVTGIVTEHGVFKPSELGAVRA
jgi:methylthioribose-1-phosphate isomerase